MQRNLDPEEIEKFSQQADQWWDSEGPMAPLHHLNPSRIQYITDRCILENKTLLDIGCGGGLLTESLAKRGGKVFGIDASAPLIHLAQAHAKENKLAIEYINATAEEHAESHQAHYDVITCMELIEHVPSPNLLLEAIAKLLKPEGILFISTLNRTLKSYTFAILGAEYVLGILPRGTHQYEKLIKPSELATSMQKYHLSMVDLSGVDYSPFKKQAKLCQDVSINYIAMARKI